MLPAQVQYAPTRHQQRETSARGEQVGQQRRRGEQVLEVVQQQEQVPGAQVGEHDLLQRAAPGVVHAQGLRQRYQDERRVGQRGQ